MSFPTKIAVENEYSFVTTSSTTKHSTLTFKYITGDKKEILDPTQKSDLFIFTTDAIMKDYLIYKYPFGFEFHSKSNAKIVRFLDHLIIDEIHIHNMIQDMNLTIMKKYMKYNEDIKIILISATLSEDDKKTIANFLEMDTYKTEYFKNYKSIKLNIEEFYNENDPFYENTYEYHQKKALDILFQKAYPELPDYRGILLFDIGQKTIDSIVEIINTSNFVDTYTLAVPLYSVLDEKYRDLFVLPIKKFIGVINTYVDNSTKNLTSLFSSTFQEKKIKKGNFRKIIIVTTNIAETAITIPFLHSVIETGYKKKVDETTQNMITLNIDESSRLQRRGRVGRILPGNVYYTYPKDTLLLNKENYEISDKHLDEYIFDFITDATYIIKGMKVVSGITFDEFLDGMYCFHTDPRIFHHKINRLISFYKKIQYR